MKLDHIQATYTASKMSEKIILHISNAYTFKNFTNCYLHAIKMFSIPLSTNVFSNISPREMEEGEEKS